MPGTRFTIATPADFVLRRDACSYGYFLLDPNRWDPEAGALARVLDVGGRAVRVAIAQPLSLGARGPVRNGGAARPAPPGTPLRVSASAALDRAERQELRAQVSRMLRLDEPAETIADFHRVDPRWAGLGRGRLSRSPTFFEDVIKTVTSCNVTWPSTVQMNRRLCEVVGRRIEVAGRRPAWDPLPRHAFPTPKKVARTRAATLRARCRAGYRDARIIELARLFTLPSARGGIDAAWFENPATPDDAVHDALLDLPGIGPYAAANIMQLLGRYARLPLDSESLRHARTVLKWEGSDRELMKRLHAHFEPFGRHAFRSYWFELWEFYEAKRGMSWTWSKEATGATFTASQF